MLFINNFFKIQTNDIGVTFMTRLAVVGATGLVGTKMLETIDRKNIKFDELVLFSSARSAG